MGEWGRSLQPLTAKSNFSFLFSSLEWAERRKVDWRELGCPARKQSEWNSRSLKGRHEQLNSFFNSFLSFINFIDWKEEWREEPACLVCGGEHRFAKRSGLWAPPANKQTSPFQREWSELIELEWICLCGMEWSEMKQNKSWIQSMNGAGRQALAR